LPQLLDLTKFDTFSDLSSRFDLIASALLRDYYLVLDSTGSAQDKYEVIELELYLRKDGCHEDPFAHATEEQATSGRWYFHRSPRRSEDASRSATSMTGYRGGTRKGMDLTFGGPVTSGYFASSRTAPAAVVRGGVLLRSIRRISDSTLISGPSLLVDEVLRGSGSPSIPDLVQNKWVGDTSALSPSPHFPRLYLQGRPPAERSSAQIYTSPRIGLDLAHPGTTAYVGHPRVSFVSRAYRYFVHPEKLTANGRIQTFLGVLAHHLCRGVKNPSRRVPVEELLSGLKDPEASRYICATTGLKMATVERYLAEYEAGLEKGDLAKFTGPVGKGVAGSPARYLRMVGTL
ncbi:hypothetical protein PUNSTDRAFT_31796, partial [Punctularia strigosozonata HHB-11173 SS5]|uniref:uncharacterized protein n=1 Tax=Punctularia strigosozonata (strain HHB-11173) TaxID=741275 RepID=UPI0004416539